MMKTRHFESLSLRVSIAVLALCLIGIGVYNGEVKTVLAKAINICLECIGIG